MGAGPPADRFAHSADDGQFVGVGTWRDGRKRRGRGEVGLEGAAALAAPAHLSPANQEGEHRQSCGRGGEASFGENVSGQTG